MKHPGRPRDERREAYTVCFALKRTQKVQRNLTQRLLDQLDRCKDDEARKLLLGIREAM